MTDTPTGTVTFLFTDIEGSTKLWEDYPARMPEVLQRHDDILRSAVEDHDGYVFKTVGDAFCAAFSHPRKALRAALDAQRALFAERWGKPIRSLRIRMALHTGYAELERGGDYFGPAVNRVARLISLAYGGQVLLSGTTHDQVCDHPEMVDEQAGLVELGEHRLKDLSRPERICQLVVPGLLERYSPPLRTDDAPEEVEERYRIKTFLGSGGFAKVYLTYDEVLDLDVAYKVLHPWHVHDEEFVERFKREARNAAKLRSHPNVVPVHDRGVKEDGTYYMVMEYLPGGSLEDLLEREGPLPARRVLGITLQVAQALSEAHEQGVIHRDIKPENILLTKRGDAKVTDFGIAKAAEAATKLTRTGLNPGTVHYMSPEQIEGEEATFRSDLYALGVVLYKMLAGKLPFDGKTTQEIQRKHLHEQARPLKEINPNVPERVEAVVVRLLAKNPKERYPDAAALIADIQQARDEPDTVVDDTGPTTPDLERATDDLDIIKEDTRPTTVRVPDLIGRRLARTRSMLAEASLSLGTQDQAPSETVPEGKIVEQTPPAWTEAERGSSVSVTVSSGPSTVEIPDLTGQRLSQARGKLAKVGLKLGGQNKAPSDTVTKGGIIEQEPAAGMKVEQGSPVSVTVSTGSSTVEVPDLAGLNRSEANSTLAAADLKLGGTDEIPSDKLPEGEIVRQHPAAGTKAKQGSSVSITVSSGPSTVRIPDLARQQLSQAASTLAEANLTLGDQNEAPSETVPRGGIIGQTPPAGTRAPQGSTVSVTVSSGPVKAILSWASRTGAPKRPSAQEAERASLNAEPVPAGSQTEENRRVGPEGSSRQTAQGATGRSGRRAKLWIGAGLLCAVVVVGLIAALAYSLTGEDVTATGEDATAASNTTPTSEDAAEETELVTADFTLISTFSGHSESVYSVAFSPDGSLLASGSGRPPSEGTVKLWNPQSGEEFQTLTEPNPVFSVAFSPDGNLLASGNDENTVKLWDPRSGEELRTLSGDSNSVSSVANSVHSVAFSPDGSLLASKGSGNTVKLWDPRSGEELRTLTGHYGPVYYVAFSPDGSLLASGSANRTVKLWDPQSGEELRTLTEHSESVDSVAFSPDGSLLASGSGRGTVELWDPQSGKELQTLSRAGGSVYSVAFSPDGGLLASGSKDDTIKLWDPQSGEELRTLTGHSGPVSSVAFSPDGSLLASGSWDGTVKVWERGEDEQ